MHTTTCSYRKTKTGVWAVMGPASIVRQGATVTVTKKDGSTKEEHITSTGKPFRVDGREMVYGYTEPRSGSGSRSGSGEACWECGRPGARIEAADSSGISGVVCSSCARMSPNERSFA